MVNKRRPQKKSRHTVNEVEYKINHQITALEVRLVGESISSRVCSIQEALTVAENMGLDLVEINGSARPPVCKIIDYSKFKYEQKRIKDKLKTKANITKEITITTNIGENDIAVKQRHAIAFLQKGFNVKVILAFPGRTIMFKKDNMNLLNSFVDTLKEYCKIDGGYKDDNKKISVILHPSKGLVKQN